MLAVIVLAIPVHRADAAAIDPTSGVSPTASILRQVADAFLSAAESILASIETRAGDLAAALSNHHGRNDTFTAAAAVPVSDTQPSPTPVTTASQLPAPSATSEPSISNAATAPLANSPSSSNTFAIQSAIAQLSTGIHALTTLLATQTPSSRIESQIAALQSALSSQGTGQSYNASASVPQQVAAGGSGGYAAANNIGSLSGVTITNANLTSSEIPNLSGSYLSLNGGTLTGALTDSGSAPSSFAGFLGIGTTSPGSALAIGGVANLTTATSTFYSTGGINLTGGCFSINGTCVNGGGTGNVSSGTQGQFAFYSVGGTTLAATSSLFLSQSGNIGIGTTTPLAMLDVAGLVKIGTNISSGDDAELLISRTAINPLSSGGSHAIRDESTYQQSSGSGGYASFDAITTIAGSISDNHYHAFQARPNIALSVAATISDVAGLTFQPTISGSGTVSNSYGLHMYDALGSGPIGAQYGIWCDSLTRGASNYCIYNSGSARNYLGTGVTQIGTGGTLQFPSSFSTYGALLTHDASGVVLDNPNLTIINGVLTMSSGAAKVLASATNLQLESTSGTILMRPAATTVGTWTSAGLAIGTTTPYSRLEVWGPDSAASTTAFLVANSASTTEFTVLDNGNATLAGNLIQNSDRRLKTNIQSLDASSSLAAIRSINPVTFNWVDPSKGSVPQYGFIAQQVQSVFPNLVSTTSPTALTPDGTLSLNYIDLIAPIVRAIQQLDQELTSLASTVAGFAQSITTEVLTAHQVNTNELCDGSTCFTVKQLAALVATQSAQQGVTSTSNATGTPDSTRSPQAPVIQINGDNPAIIQVGDTYSDLGATIIAPQADLNLGIKTFLNSEPMNPIQLDTTQAATDTIDYVATDQNGLTSTSTRTVIVQAPPPDETATTSPAAPSATPANDNEATTSTAATSSPN